MEKFALGVNRKGILEYGRVYFADFEEPVNGVVQLGAS